MFFASSSKIGAFDLRVVLQLWSRTLQCHAAGLQDVRSVGDIEREPRVLFYKQDRGAFTFELPDCLEYHPD